MATDMNFVLRNLLATSLASLPLSFSLSSLAQESAGENIDDESWRVQEIIVIGNQSSYQNQNASVVRGNIPLIELPQSVQVLNRALLDDQDLQTLTQALANVSGVVPNQEAETVLVNPIVRGFESEIFLDGLLGYGDTAVIDPSSLIGVERVEVAKGPTSTLYGGGTGAPVGGLINLVTKTPHAESAVDLSLYGGSFGTYSGAIDINQPLSDDIGFRLAAESYTSDDYIEGADTDRLTVNPSLRIELGEQTEFLFRGIFNKIEQLEYTGLPAEVANLPGVDPYQFTGALDGPRTEVRNLSLHGVLNHQFSDSLSAKIQLRRYENEFEEYSSFAYTAFFPVTGSSAFILKGQLPVDLEETTLDVSFNWEVDGGAVAHSLLGGVFLDSTDYQGGSAFDFNPIGILDYASGVNDLSFGPVPPIDPAGLFLNKYETRAIYLQDQISFSDNFKALVSGRYTRYEHSEGFPSLTSFDTDHSEFDYRLGLTYLINDSFSLFAGYATGSRLSLFFTGENGSPPEPETSRSAEAGIKFDFEDSQISGSLVAFRLLRDNIPTLLSLDPFAQGQAGEQESDGVELDLIWEPTTNWSVLFNYAVMNAEIKEAIPTSFGNFAVGAGLSRIPDYRGRLAGHYRFSGGELDGLSLGAGISFSDEAPLTDFNVFYSDDYAVIDLHADYAFDNFELGLNVQNLLDDEYFIPFQFLLGEVVRPGMPLAAFVTIKVNL